jgi:parvulin-like peptidyl-prolyl isomerase
MQLREWARENVIERILLRMAATADPEPVPPQVIEQGLEEARTAAGGLVGCGTRNSDDEIRQKVEADYRLQRLIARVQSGVRPASEKEIAAFYKKNRDRFRTSELCWAKHIVKNVGDGADEQAARDALEAAQAELRAGAPFEEVADRHSDCAGNGGDLGWFPHGEMVDEFEEIVFSLPTGATSEIFRSVFGWHIARVYGRKPSGVRPLAEVREEITAILNSERRQKALEDYLDALRAKADIRQTKAAV